jgi:zinc protease
VAAKYLTRNNRTVGVYYPTAKAERAHIPATPNVAKLVDGYKGRTAVAAGEMFDPTPENIEKRVVRGQLGSIKTAYLQKKTRGEMIDIRLNLRFGTLESLTGLVTPAELLPTMLLRGSTKHSRQQITDAFDRLGARVSFTGQPALLAVMIKVKTGGYAQTGGRVAARPRIPRNGIHDAQTRDARRLDGPKDRPNLSRVPQPATKDVLVPEKPCAL